MNSDEDTAADKLEEIRRQCEYVLDNVADTVQGIQTRTLATMILRVIDGDDEVDD